MTGLCLHRHHACVASVFIHRTVRPLTRPNLGVRARILARCKQDNDDGEADKPDIEELARRLSREAKRRRMEGREAEGEPDRGQESSLDSLGRILGDSSTDDADLYAPERPEDALRARAELGDGGFIMQDFELVKRLSIWSAQGMTAGPLRLSEGGGITQRSVAGRTVGIVTYAANYVSGRPFEGPVLTLLKEYPPGTRRVGWNEIRVASRLQDGLPKRDEKWKCAASDPERSPDAATSPILGFFSGPSSRDAMFFASAEGGAALEPESLYVVQKWEGLQPLSLVLSGMGPFTPATGRAAGGSDSEEAGTPWSFMRGLMAGGAGSGANGGVAPRERWLAAVVAKAFRSVTSMHARGVYHGSLCSEVVFVSGGEALVRRSASDLLVRVHNLGFAQMSEDGQGTDADLAQRDWQDVALLVLEASLSALSTDEGVRGGGKQSLSLLLDTMRGNVADLREYLEQEPAWEHAVAFLSRRDGAGWALLEDLVAGGAQVAKEDSSGGAVDQWLGDLLA